MKITEEKLDEFIADIDKRLENANSMQQSIALGWIIMAGKELKTRRAGKEPKNPVMDVHLQLMIKHNKDISGVGSDEIPMICNEIIGLKKK